MSFRQDAAQLEAASRETIQRIREDRETAPPKIKPLLAHIEEHLFNPDLRVSELKRACGIRDNSISIQFRSALGQPPSAYIEECRLETASRLLRDTDLSISAIAEQLGYSNLQVFSTAFQRWSGQRPSPYRKQFRRMPSPQTTFDEAVLRVDHLRRALMGTLPQVEAHALLQRLRDIYEGQDATDFSEFQISEEPNLDVGQLTSEDEKREAMNFYCERLTGASLSEQRHVLRRESHRPWLALFHHLLQESDAETRSHNLARACQLVELALECLYRLELERLFETNRPLPDTALANLKARGWAYLGDSRRQSTDLAGAEKALEIAQYQLPLEASSQKVIAEICYFKSVLRWQQQAMEEADALAARAIPLFRRLNEPGPLARALIMRAIIQNTFGKPRNAILDLCEALQLVDIEAEPTLTLKAHCHLISAYLTAGYTSEAARILELAKNLVKHCEDPSLIFYLQWLQGCLALEQGSEDVAEERWLDARESFLNRRGSIRAALISLDLTLMFFRNGKISKAFRLATETLPFVERLTSRQGSNETFRLLQDALDSKCLTLDVLQQVRRGLELAKSQRRKNSARQAYSHSPATTLAH